MMQTGVVELLKVTKMFCFSPKLISLNSLQRAIISKRYNHSTRRQFPKIFGFCKKSTAHFLWWKQTRWILHNVIGPPSFEKSETLWPLANHVFTREKQCRMDFQVNKTRNYLHSESQVTMTNKWTRILVNDMERQGNQMGWLELGAYLISDTPEGGY